MVNINLNMTPQTGFGGGFPGLGGMDGARPMMAPMQQMFMLTVNTMQMAMMALMAQMIGPQVAMPGSSAFGAMPGGTPLSSPLGGFLGSNPGGAAAQGPTAAHPRPGGRIPGGKSLYKKGHGMFHKGAHGAPKTYAFENSPAGIKFAADHNYSSIDIDMQITKDGVPVATHWAQPMKRDGFHDPLGKLGKNTKISDMTLAEVMRLRNKDGKSRIYPVATMIDLLKKNGISGDLEAKNDPRFATDRVMGYLADLVRNAGIKANLKTIYHGSRSDRILAKAQEYGFWVRTAKGAGHQRRELGYGH
jgi:hypothetical protein